MEFREIVFCLFVAIEFICEQLIIFPELIGNTITRKEKQRIWIPLLCGTYIYSYNGYGTIVSTSLLLILPIILGALFIIFKRDYSFAIMIWNYFIITIVFLLKLMVLIFEGLIYKKNTIELNYGKRTWMEVVFELVLILLLILFGNLIKRKEISIKTVCKKFWPGFTLTVVSGYKMISYLIKDGWNGSNIKTLILNIYIIVAVFFFLLIILLISIMNQMKEEQNMLIIRQNTSEMYYTELMERYRIIGKLNHDIKNERVYLYKCIENGEIEKAKKHLEELQQFNSDNKRIWTGFEYIDFIINVKLEQIEKKNIQFIFNSNFSSFPLKDEEICIVFGNLIDNAISATEKCEQQERWIKIEILQHNDMCNISISNSSTRYPIVNDGRFQSSKEDKRIHGWGLQNVEKIVKKHNGTVKYQYTDKLFEVHVMFWKIE